MPIVADEVVAVDRDGTELLRRPLSAFERAEREHGPAQQVEGRMHPVCAGPSGVPGMSTYRFADGLRWCMACEVAWHAA